ncbi:putative disease resistance protein [Raphanus sativus]|nr:putative disease resistance protein [Raphanus sativus]
MAETLLSFGVEKLWNLLVRESERFQEVEEQFDGLKSDVEMLRCFLEDADAKKQTSAMVRNTIKEIKEIVLDAEDIVETFLLKKELGNTSGIRNSVRRYSSAVLERRRLASDMKAISKRISKVIRNMQSLGVQQVIVSEGYTQSLPEIQREMRQTFSSDNEDHLVGLDKNIGILVGYLLEEDRDVNMVNSPWVYSNPLILGWVFTHPKLIGSIISINFKTHIHSG